MPVNGNAAQVRDGFTGNSALTAKANAAVTGRRFVKVVAGGGELLPLVEPATATDRVVFGAAAWSQVVGETLTVKDLSRSPRLEVEAPVAAGDWLRIGPGGALVPVADADKAALDIALVRGVAAHAAVAGAVVITHPVR